MIDIWTLIMLTLMPTVLMTEPPTVAVRISINTIPFESRAACENSQSVAFLKAYMEDVALYTCEFGDFKIDPEILAVPDALGRIIYLKENWDDMHFKEEGTNR